MFQLCVLEGSILLSALVVIPSCFNTSFQVDSLAWFINIVCLQEGYNKRVRALTFVYSIAKLSSKNTLKLLGYFYFIPIIFGFSSRIFTMLSYRSFDLTDFWLTFWVTVACGTDMTLFGYDQGVFGK